MRGPTRPPLLFRAFLRLYPAAFRNEYAGEMWQIFQARRRDAGGPFGRLLVWLATFFDTLASAAATHWDLLRQDVGYALRSFRRTPGFTATVMVVAALGIGANTAAFSLTDHVLIRPLPFRDPGRLVALWQTQMQQGYGRFELSPGNYRDWKAARSFDGMACYSSVSVNLVGDGQLQRLDGWAVEPNLLPLLGAQPALGRAFSDEDDREGAPGTVLLSWGLWQAAFAGDPAVVGHTVTLDDETFTVIGVMPRSYAFPTREAQFWVTHRWSADMYDDRSNTFLRVVGRLKPGVTVAQARAEMSLLTEGLATAYPDPNEGIRSTVNPLRDELSQQARVLVLALLGAAACVLLIACLNLASLLLTRALARRRELVLRTALGAGRERLIRQLLTESLLLAVGGGVLGVALAVLALPVLSSLVPAGLPVTDTPTIDLRVLLVAAGVTVLAGILFGVVPALKACGNVDAEVLREGARAAVGGRRARLRQLLVVLEVSASIVLLVSSGLLLRTLWKLQDRDPGFRTDGVLTLRTWLPLPRYQNTGDRAIFYQRVLDATRALPGVQSAAYVSFLPMAMGGGIWAVSLPDRPQKQSELKTVSLRFLTPGYFDAMQIPLRSGRDVLDSDTMDAPFVAVVSESLVRRYWPGEEGVGKRFKVAFDEVTIVGVVGDVRVRGLERDSEPQVYLSHRQVRDGSLVFYMPKDMVVRAATGSATLVPALRAIVAAADPRLPISNIRTMEDVVSAQTAPRRVQLHVIGTFAALAFLLAGIGIYGLLSFAVSNRSQEIGVRMALGATPRSILVMVVREGLVLAAIGVTVGMGFAYLAGRSLQALLVGVAPTDGPTLIAALVVALLMTLFGSLVPAWRAARVDPAGVMRAE